MRKIKKSIKIIISMACVLAVAVAGVVTAILVTNSRKNRGENPPATPAYALTVSQKELGKEISDAVSTSVSDKKLKPVEYSPALASVLDVSQISYLDGQVAWYGEQMNYKAFVLDSEGDPSGLLDLIKTKNFVSQGYISETIEFAGKNHFVVRYKYSDTSFKKLICSVENHDVVLNKLVEYEKRDGNFFIGENSYTDAFADDYFVLMEKFNEEYNYVFYEYLTDYSNYDAFKYPVENNDDLIECFANSGVFAIESEKVLTRNEFGNFVPFKESSQLDLSLKKGEIVESKNESSTPMAGSELIGGKYVSYSYKLVINGSEKTIDLAGQSRISSVVYSGDEYFGIFTRGVDSNHKLKDSGIVMYFDYDLNLVVKYDAKYESFAKIMYLSNDSFLTGEGLVSGKVSVECSKIYDFEANGYEFLTVFANGNFVLKDSNKTLNVFNLNLNKISTNEYDEIVSNIDDEKLIFSRNGEFYLYNTKTNVAEPKKYEKTTISYKTSMYFIEENGSLSLYCGEDLIDSNISDYYTGDNYLTYTANNVEKSYYFVEKQTNSVESIEFSSSAVGGNSIGNVDFLYGAEPEGGAVDEEQMTFNSETEWYEYEDKFFVTTADTADDKINCDQIKTDSNSKAVIDDNTRRTEQAVYKATHCIQNGFYSKTKYVNYLEFHYYKENSSGVGTYLPFRIYYRVDIDKGRPKLTMYGKGHMEMGYKKIVDGTSTSDTIFIANGNAYQLDTAFGLGQLDKSPNYANSQSFDYLDPDTKKGLYIYTDSADSSFGFLFHEDSDFGSGKLSSAEVYGNSIRVNIYFTFTPRTVVSAKESGGMYSEQTFTSYLTGMSFGEYMPVGKEVGSTSENLDIEDYYNDLYYQSVVVSYFNENVNYYNDVIQTDRNEIINEYFFKKYISTATFNEKNNVNVNLSYSDDVSSSNMKACISAKMYVNRYYDTENLKYEYDYQRINLGGEDFKTNIIGGNLVGITTPKQFNYLNTTFNSLYNKSVRTYNSEIVEFSISPLDNVNPGLQNEDSVVKYKYLNFDTSNSTYYIDVHNEDYIYCDGGLNTFRYIYCLYEPQTFYFDIDYNISELSGDNKNIDNEINYLQSYAGLKVGLDNKNDSIDFNKTWVYTNVNEQDFGNYIYYTNKYYPYDFTDDYLRATLDDISILGDENDIKAVQRKHENRVLVREYRTESQRYFYVIIDGVRYYFQKNFKEADGKCSIPFAQKVGESEIFVVAYKDYKTFKESTGGVFEEADETYGFLKDVDESAYYDAYFSEESDGTGVYKKGTELVYLRIPKSNNDDGSFDAYYYRDNIHKRTNVVYDGYFNLDEEGNVVVGTEKDDYGINKPIVNDGVNYSIRERFSFLYIDDLRFTSLPKHTHYDFNGWKVILTRNDGSKYEYLINLTTIEEDGNFSFNGAEIDNTGHQFLPEDTNFFNFWRNVSAQGAMTWNNSQDNPIQFIAQWTPKKCDVKAVLFNIETVESTKKYYGYQYNPPADGNSYYINYPPLDIVGGKTIIPTFKVNNEDIDADKNGILDFGDVSPQFDYDKSVNFYNIGQVMEDNNFTQSIINTTGLVCQFLGWCYNQTATFGTESEEGAGTYISISGEENGRVGGDRSKQDTIDKYIGDTTTITIYAYYATTRYNLGVRFHPMGGATTDGDTDKGYYSDYNSITHKTGNDNIYNGGINPAVYEIIISDREDKFVRNYATAPKDNYNILGITSDSYGIDFRDDGNPFFAGKDFNLQINLNEQYYLKTITIRDLVLYDDTKHLDIFSLTFTYTYNNSGGLWSGVCKSQTDSNKTLAVVSADTYFKVGLYNNKDTGGYENNLISISHTIDANNQKMTWFINVEELANPGRLLANGLLEGNDGFTLSVYPESYTIKTEDVDVITVDKNGEKTEGPFNNNNAMLVSSQPLTNIEGKELIVDKPCYIWLGTSKYLFTNAWRSDLFQSGYYMMNSDGTTVAVPYSNYSYEEFIRQRIQVNENVVIYYDATEYKVYYPVQYSSWNNERVVLGYLTSTANRIYFDISGVRYFINLVDKPAEDTNFKFEGDLTNISNSAKDFIGTGERECVAFTTQHPNNNRWDEDDIPDYWYDRDMYWYYTGNPMLIVKLKFEILENNTYIAKITYRTKETTGFSVGYNNTRVLAIDPDQDNIYFSESPSEARKSQYYELNYYLSSLTIGSLILSFERPTREVMGSTTDVTKKRYGLFTINTTKDYGVNFVRLTDIRANNDGVDKGELSDSPYYLVNYFGDNFIIQDAFKITFENEEGKVGATEYYFYLTRNMFGFTRYFLIYDEYTTQKNNLENNYPITLTYKEFRQDLTISVLEEDLYDATNRSFEISYADKGDTYNSAVPASKYNYDYSVFYEDILLDENRDINPLSFYQIKEGSINGASQKTLASLMLDSKVESKKMLRELTTTTWQSLSDFSPVSNRKLLLSAKSGYLIRYIKVYVGTSAKKDASGAEIVEESYNLLMNFQFINESLDDLNYYSTGQNYSYSSFENDKLISYISYKVDETSFGSDIAYGYKLLENENLGMYYSNFYDTSWGAGDQGSFNFDHLYLLLSGIYEDIKIEFATTSYSEYLFENGQPELGYNPLLNKELYENGDQTTGNVSYRDILMNNSETNNIEGGYLTIPISLTHLSLYTMTYENDADYAPSLDRDLLMKHKDRKGNDVPLIYTMRYYYKDQNYVIAPHTLRLIFLGTGSKIKYGLHFLSTHENYSVYFTNGRYYNEQISSSAENPFKELEAYSGRTASNNAIKDATREKTNKLVYMYTGELHNENSAGNYTGFYVDSSYIVTNESNFKFFMATTAFVNEIGVKTESYLFNQALATASKPIYKDGEFTQTSLLGTHKEIDDYAGKDLLYNRPTTNSEFEIFFTNSSKNLFSHYQLDTTHKTKSWFNDTVLSNIQLFSYQDKEEGALPKTWVNRNEDDESELTRVEMGGLDFNWKYYEISGYYLRYIMIKIADLDAYFAIDVSDFRPIDVENEKLTLLKTIRIYDTERVNDPTTEYLKSYDYRFNLYYYKTDYYSYYQLYPVFGEEVEVAEGGKKFEIDEFESVSLMSNDISVGFYSDAYGYYIQFDNYNLTSAHEYISSYSHIKNYLPDVNGNDSETLDNYQQIFYDSATKLEMTQTMPGYTFIGWGSSQYYDGTGHKWRYVAGNGKDKPSTWNTSATWYDPTSYFVQPGKSGEENMQLFLNLKDEYAGIESKPSGAFYAYKSYFMTDTGFKAEGDNCQNYNFFADYITIFSNNLSVTHNKAVAGMDIIHLYAIWKANTYAIEFDVNNQQHEDPFYIDYSNGDPASYFTYEFTSDKIAFRDKTKVGTNDLETLLCYVTFDTNNWYTLLGDFDKLMFSEYYNNGNPIPYVKSTLNESGSAISKLAVDMFGYSWLGWYYTKRSNYYWQDDRILTDTRVFDSYYTTNSINTNSLGSVIPTFNYQFLSNSESVKFELDFDSSTTEKNAQMFNYYGRHKETGSKLNSALGYVYFYDYRSKEHASHNINGEFDGSGSVNFNYIITYDYLNELLVDVTGNYSYYDGDYLSPMLLSYYDTVFGEACYSVKSNSGRYSLSLDLNAENMRRFKLFANWSQNKYNLIFNNLDATGASTYDWELGSSEVDSDLWDNYSVSAPVVWFNDKDNIMAKHMLDQYAPTRIGYDLIGWSYNYIPLNTISYQSLISSINVPNQYAYLCKELLSAYASMNGVGVGGDISESNVLMLDGNRTNKVYGNTWVLNQPGTAERLGDAEVDNHRYVYAFPIWKAQTFSISISMNISAQSLYNLHEKDSSFAVALYESADETCKTVTGVNSKYYTFNTEMHTNTANDPSMFYHYYNDIIANVRFEIEFDTEFTTAICSFGGKTYKLKDLMMTSAGYYFLGLMIDDDLSTANSQKNASYFTSQEQKEYLVRNLLRTSLEYEGGLVHHRLDVDNNERYITDNSGNYIDRITYEKIQGLNKYNAKTQETLMFNVDTYRVLIDERFDEWTKGGTEHQNDTLLSENDYEKYTYNSAKNYYTQHSSNFGYIRLNAYKYGSSSTMVRHLNIISEREGNEFYLYVIHNNVKYYVVYYNSLNGKLDDSLTWDKTFLYYNKQDVGGVVNRYIVHFDTGGRAYYVDDSYLKRVELDLYIALYVAKTNKLNLEKTASGTSIISYNAIRHPDGNLLGGFRGYNLSSGNNILGVGDIILTDITTREFTLYADWEVRRISTTVVNGNNCVTYNEMNDKLEITEDEYSKINGRDGGVSYDPSKQSAESNTGLAGYFAIGSVKSVNNSNHNMEYRIRDTYNFYSSREIEINPFYAGRYLSEMVLEFDTLVEEGFGDVVSFVKRHNTLVLKFSWISSEHDIVISSISLNGVTLSNVSNVTQASPTSLAVNSFTGIDILSLLDKYSLNRALNTNAGLRIHENDSDKNEVNMLLTNMMTSLTITCKFSIQTFLVEVYTVVSDSDISYGKTSFGSIEEMHLNSNYFADNRGLYGNPYISSSGYTSGSIPTISTDCAQVTNLSFNVPFYYFLTDTLGNQNAKDKYGQLSVYALNYIYEKSLYKSGTTNAVVKNDYGALQRFIDEMTNKGYKFVENWYINPEVKDGVVKFQSYSQNEPVDEDVRLYACFTRENQQGKVVFYHWDNNINEYVKYTNNANDYAHGGTYFPSTGNKITKLPSPTNAPWFYDESGAKKDFLGYIYLTEDIVADFTNTSINEFYNNNKFQASNTFQETQGDIYSALHMNKIEGLTNTHDEEWLYSYLYELSATDIFAERLVVYDNKYFTQKIGGTSILDGVRLEVTLPGNYKVYKDFKMLNTLTELPTNEIVYAIPLYEEIKLEIKDLFIYKNNVTLTTNTNMIQSCVFETNSLYTIFYDPKDLRVAVSSSEITKVSDLKNANMTLSMADESSKVKKVDTTYKVVDENNPEYFDYRKVSFDANGTPYVYVYYMKPDGRNTAFYMSSAKTVSYSDLPTVDVSIEMYDSPLEKRLEGDLLKYYSYAWKEIEDNESLSSQEKLNRKRAVYIMLQLTYYSGFLTERDSAGIDPVYYLMSGGSLPTDGTKSGYSIMLSIQALNTRMLGILDADEFPLFVFYEQFSIMRLAYSLAYYFSQTEMIDHGKGLDQLTEGENLVDNFRDYADEQVTDRLTSDAFSSNKIAPGDVMVSYRHNNGRKVWDATDEEGDRTIFTMYGYQYDPEAEGYNLSTDCYENATYAMFIAYYDGVYYFFDSSRECVITTDIFDNTTYQENDIYEKFYNGTADDGYYYDRRDSAGNPVNISGLTESGYYTILPDSDGNFTPYKVIENNGGYFYYEKWDEQNLTEELTTYFYKAVESQTTPGVWLISPDGEETKTVSLNNKYMYYGDGIYYIRSEWDSNIAWHTAYKNAYNYEQQYKYDQAHADWQKRRDDTEAAALAVWAGMTAEEKEAEPNKNPFEVMKEWDLNNIEPNKTRDYPGDYTNSWEYCHTKYLSLGLTRYYTNESGREHSFTGEGGLKYYQYDLHKEYYWGATKRPAGTKGSGWDNFGGAAAGGSSHHWLIYNVESAPIQCRIYTHFKNYFRII